MISRLSSRFKPAQKTNQTPEQARAAYIAETLAADEATVVERLRTLVGAATCDPADGATLATLDGLLEALPAARLLLVLSEGHVHGFLGAAELDGLLTRLPLRRVARLYAAAAPRDRAGVLARAALLDRVAEVLIALSMDRPHAEQDTLPADALADLAALAFGGAAGHPLRLADLVRHCIERGKDPLLGAVLRTVGLPARTAEALTDLHIGWLWRHHAAALLAVAARQPEQATAQAARLLSLVGEPQQAAAKGLDEATTRAALAGLLGGLEDEQIWQQIRGFVQQRCACQRGWAFGWALGLLDAGRTAQIIAARYDDAELGVYWMIFSEAVRGELVRLGRGRLRAPGRDWGRHARSSSRARAGRREEQARSVRLPAAQREALRVMTERYGFSEGMSYQEAQRRYWRLAMQYHPDRAGATAAQQSKMGDLNQAWDAAKQCFARQAV